jgi:hypothetical protein
MDGVRDLQPKQGWVLLVLAILANILLCVILVFLFDWMISQSSEPDAIWVEELEEETPVTAEPTFAETQVPLEMTTPTIIAIPTLAAVPTLAPPPTPEPTRREFLEPTKPPYVFPTPIYIPPVPRVRPTATRSR